MRVIKRDGTFEDYNEQKIINACSKAASRGMVELSEKDYAKIVNNVWSKIEEIYNENEDIEYCTDPELIDEKFGNIVDLVIDGGIGGIEGSTVVDCTGGEAEIVRQGKGWLDEG